MGAARIGSGAGWERRGLGAARLTLRSTGVYTDWERGAGRRGLGAERDARRRGLGAARGAGRRGLVAARRDSDSHDVVEVHLPVAVQVQPVEHLLALHIYI